MSLRQWSSEIYTAEFKELQAGSLSVSRDGQLGVLAGRRHLALINMDDPKELVKKVGRTSRWEVGAAQWNPSSQYSNHIALFCNDKIEIYVWDSSDFSTDEPIRGHTRQVSDIHWNSREPNLLASSSLDGNIYVWDLRDLKKPCQSFQTIIGASHIRWSRDGTYLASAHEGDVKLWDARNDSAPLTYLSAHMSRVHSIDWSYTENSLVTASNDCTVKFHTVTGKSVETSNSSLSTSVPVWRACHTPFGDGMVTVLVPHFGAHEHSLFLWNVKNLTTPVHTFVGHRDVILDFEWRKCGGGALDYQMVTWSKDQSLRMWALDPETQYRCGVHESDLESESSDDDESIDDIFDQATDALEAIYMDNKVTRDESVENKPVKKVEFSMLRSASGDRQTHRLEKSHDSPVKEHSPESTMENTLQQEFALLDTNFNFIQVTDRDLEKRICKVVATTAHSRLLLLIVFPPTYPVNTSPIFTFLKGSSMNPQNKSKILKTLQDNASQQVRRNRACLERCLRQLEFQLDQINQEAVVEDEATKNSFPFVRSSEFYQTSLNYGVFQDTSIPYPRTSGSRFCSNGLLVCFGRPAYQIKVSNPSEASLTPRAYSAYLNTVGSGSDQDLLKTGLRPNNSRFGNMHTMNLSVSSPNFPDMGRFGGSESNQSQCLGKESSGNANTIKRGRFKVKRVTSGAQEDGFLKPRRSILNKQKMKSKETVSLKVTVYDISPMLPISRPLAEKYRVLDDPVEMCNHNSKVAAELDFAELAQIWQLCGQVVGAASEGDDDGDWGPWRCCPLGKPLISSIIKHHVDCRDFQTVAMLVCALTEKTKVKKNVIVENAVELDHPGRGKYWFLKSGALTGGGGGHSNLLSAGVGDSPYHTVHGPGLINRGVKSNNSGSETKLENIFMKKNIRSNSWTDASQEESISIEYSKTTIESPATLHGDSRFGLLEDADSSLYSSALAAYSDALYNWNLLEQRAIVVKHGAATGVEDEMSCVSSTCAICEERIDTFNCKKCRKPGLECVICRLPVSGLGLVCPSCGHGGHLQHMWGWWGDHSTCPASCGCNCKKYL